MHSKINDTEVLLMKQLLDELISTYFDNEVDNQEAVPFGLTNFTQIITIDGEKYVARIYDTHSKSIERLIFEIDLITHLENSDLPYKLPAFLTTKSGNKFVELSNGQLGSINVFIEGIVPELTAPLEIEDYGRTVGQLMLSMQKYRSAALENDIRFYNVYDLHSLCNESSLRAFIDQPPFEVNRTHLAAFVQLLEGIESNKCDIEQLPHQIIHHDLLIFNLLIDSESRKISGVLDFDFASYDIRALELAICLNHILQLNDHSLAKVELFLQQYSTYITLTEEELNWVPFLMQMYYASLLCIYIGQFYSGRNVSQYFQFILDQLATRSLWLEHNKPALIDLLKG